MNSIRAWSTLIAAAILIIPSQSAAQVEIGMDAGLTRSSIDVEGGENYSQTIIGIPVQSLRFGGYRTALLRLCHMVGRIRPLKRGSPRGGVLVWTPKCRQAMSLLAIRIAKPMPVGMAA